MFEKKPKKTPEELRKERDEVVSKTSKDLKMQIAMLTQKKDRLFGKLREAHGKGLAEPEKQARALLKQTMTAIKRAESMLMTIELAVESRDLAEMNVNFLESIRVLSEDILASGQKTSNGKVKKANDTYLRAVYESRRQTDQIDQMLAVGEYASAISEDGEQYSDLDAEIDAMLEEQPATTSSPVGIKGVF